MRMSENFNSGSDATGANYSFLDELAKKSVNIPEHARAPKVSERNALVYRVIKGANWDDLNDGEKKILGEEEVVGLIRSGWEKQSPADGAQRGAMKSAEELWALTGTRGASGLDQLKTDIVKLDAYEKRKLEYKEKKERIKEEARRLFEEKGVETKKDQGEADALLDSEVPEDRPDWEYDEKPADDEPIIDDLIEDSEVEDLPNEPEKEADSDDFEVEDLPNESEKEGDSIDSDVNDPIEGEFVNIESESEVVDTENSQKESEAKELSFMEKLGGLFKGLGENVELIIKGVQGKIDKLRYDRLWHQAHRLKTAWRWGQEGIPEIDDMTQEKYDKGMARVLKSMAEIKKRKNELIAEAEKARENGSATKRLIFQLLGL